MKKVTFAIFSLLVLSACNNEVGTQSWCDHKAEMPKQDWSAQDALDYAKHCVLLEPVGSESWCKDLQDKPKGDWSGNEMKSFAQHCII